MADERKTYEEKLDARVKDWNTQIELLKAKAAKAKEMTEYCKNIETLQCRQNDAKENLREPKTAGDESWDELRRGAEKAWTRVKIAYHDASSSFK
jgi:hypothetical protein